MAYKISKYFLGETTPNGFKTSFDKQIHSDDFYTYILKGGPGTGKSSLMKKIALEFSGADDLDLYHCSCDPNSLDAIVLKNAKIAIVDGTAPHVFDAKYPGVYQSIINLGECWSKDFLSDNKAEIKRITDENSTWHSRFKRYITAFSSLNSDIYSIAKASINYEKLDGFIGRIVKKYISKTDSASGHLYQKKLSTLTKDGYITMPIDFYENIFVLKDSYFAGSDYFLQEITDIAVSRGYSVIVSECCLFSDCIYEHILIPELKLGFVSSNYINNLEMPGNAKVNFLRFYDKAFLLSKKNRIEFSKKAAIELKAEAVSSLANAKKVHDVLETFYIDAVDFEKINEITDTLISEITLRYNNLIR